MEARFGHSFCQVIPVLGFATVSKFDLADRLVKSIDYPVEHLVVIDNSGFGKYQPPANGFVKNVWVLPIPFGLGLVGAWNLVVKTTPYAPYWLLVNDDAWFEAGALQAIAENADPTTINHPKVNPHWSAIVLGEKVVQDVGLYDERFYPLYFDDNDYERRIELAGFIPKEIDAVIHHDNSASLNHKYNGVSFENNMNLFHRKVADGDNGWTWTLDTRRANRWD